MSMLARGAGAAGGSAAGWKDGPVMEFNLLKAALSAVARPESAAEMRYHVAERTPLPKSPWVPPPQRPLHYFRLRVLLRCYCATAALLLFFHQKIYENRKGKSP